MTPTRDEDDSKSNSLTPQPIVPEDVVQPFTPTQNAWDNVAGIERYVRAVLGAQNKVKPRSPTLSTGLAGTGITSPPTESPGTDRC